MSKGRISTSKLALGLSCVQVTSRAGHHIIHDKSYLPLVLLKVTDLIAGRVCIYQLPVFTLSILVPDLIFISFKGRVQDKVSHVKVVKVDDKFSNVTVS